MKKIIGREISIDGLSASSLTIGTPVALNAEGDLFYVPIAVTNDTPNEMDISEITPANTLDSPVLYDSLCGDKRNSLFVTTGGCSRLKTLNEVL